MSKNAQIQVRISLDDKEAARELFARYGLTISTALRLFIVRSLQENRMPFDCDAPVREDTNSASRDSQ